MARTIDRPNPLTRRDEERVCAATAAPDSEEVVEQARRILRTDVAVLWLLDSGGAALVAHASAGLTNVVGTRIHDRHGVSAIVDDERDAAAADDPTRSDPVTVALGDDSRSLLAAPVMRGGDRVGMVHVGTRRRRTFTPTDRDVLRLVADRIGVGLTPAPRADPASSSTPAARSDAEAADDAARVNEERLRLALEAVQMGIWDWNLRTDELQWSDETERLHGFAPGSFESTYKAFSRLVHPDDADLVRTTVGHAIEICGDYALEFRVVWPDGSVHWVNGRGRVFRGADGQPERMIGTVVDVTVPKQAAAERDQLLERERAARTDAQAANRAKDEFLATVSHELRTPLTPILAWSRMLRLGVLDDAGAARALATIERNAKSQAQLIEDLLDVSRIITGKMRLDMRPVTLAHVVEAAIESLQPAADARGVRIEARLDSGTGPIAGDAERLQQVAWNLLSNAIKFTPANGDVYVTLERADRHLVLSVRDSGKGIEPSFLPFVFERFRQAESTTTRSYGGLGLGLAIVRHLVELHGGTVAASSDGEGSGATFTVRLPLMPAAHDVPDLEPADRPPTADPAEDHYPSLRGMRILVVDDERDTCDAVRTLLSHCGAQVTTATSVAEALTALDDTTIDVLVSDIGMPGEDGYALIRALRARESARGRPRVPAVALTAYARVEDRLRVLSAGFHMHVPKPIEPMELVTVIASLTDGIGKRRAAGR